jgi:murein DD-endopeptidase MepM/ murein hydrolase activator NlpD
MKLILINRKHGGSRTVELGRWSRALLSLCCLGLPLGLVAVGYQLGQAGAGEVQGLALGSLKSDLDDQAEELEALRAEAQRRNRALTARLADLQARMTRLDAFGEHLTSMAGLEDGEFDFSQPPAIGGPMAPEIAPSFNTDLEQQFDQFDAHLSNREQQIEILESLLSRRKLAEQSWLSGRPAAKGWVSSHYGKRTDPFSGKIAMHNGIDFAGKEGTEILAVGAGVVTWAGERYGYGEMVEISHGDGFVTRYAHNKENLVKPGDVVRKGQSIALMGNTGRSTGAHVHFEVYKHGRAVDPASYIRRTRR